jgi:hypothetical protein
MEVALTIVSLIVEFRKFLADILGNAMSVSNSDNCHVFTWLDEKYIGMMQDVFQSVGVDFKRLCLWAKNNHNPTPQIAFNRAVELCMYGTKGTSVSFWTSSRT